MNLMHTWARRLAAVLVVFALLAALVQLNNVTKPALVNTDGRVFAKAVVADVLRDNVQENGSRIGDQIVSLKLEDGSLVQANSPNGLLFGTVCEPGMSVVVIASKTGTLSSYTVYSYDRMTAVIAFLAFFALLLMLVGGKKGVKSVVALTATFACFLFFFFPLLHGLSPIVAAVITATIVLALTVWLICGPTRQALAAGIASFGGVLSAGIAAEVFGRMAHLSGYNVPNIEALLFINQNSKIDVGELLFAGILFASLGAVLDIAMDVSAATAEIRSQSAEVSAQSLFKSGMRVGQDVMGTMAATLILAVFGGSLGTWVLDYVYDLPFLQLLNSNSLDIVIMQGLSGGIGVILTVPIAAGFSAVLLSRHRHQQADEPEQAKVSQA